MKTFNSALIIDDDQDLCMLVKTMLANNIQDVRCVHSLQSGKEALVEMSPEVILLDNNLPDGQGIHFIQEIKTTSPGSYIILVSAFDNLTVQALESGAHGFLEKPLSYQKVHEALSQLG